MPRNLALHDLGHLLRREPDANAHALAYVAAAVTEALVMGEDYADFVITNGMLTLTCDETGTDMKVTVEDATRYLRSLRYVVSEAGILRRLLRVKLP